MKSYKYWCQPFSVDDERLLRGQLRRAADYRRELAQIENRARVLLRTTIGIDDKEIRLKWRSFVLGYQHEAVRQCRGRATDPLPDGTPGLYWGTYLACEDAHDRSQRTTKLTSDLGQRFPRDEGLVGIHIQGTPVNARGLVGGEGSMVRIGRNLRGKYYPQHDSYGAPKLRDFFVRVGSGKTVREPVFARLHILMHRPLPDANLKWVKVKCRRTGLLYRWEVSFDVGEESRGAPLADQSGHVGVDIGWRKVDGGIRVAYWYGSDRREGSLVIPDKVLSRETECDEIHARRDLMRNAMQKDLLAYRESLLADAAASDRDDGAAASDRDDPAKWMDATQHLHSWLRYGRYVVLHREWGRARIAGDEEIFERMRQWLEQDARLYNRESHSRRKQSMSIQGEVRKLAVALAKHYRVVSVEETGMVPSLVERYERTDKSPIPATDAEETWLRALAAKRMRGASPALLRGELKLFAPKYGATYMEHDPAYTTMDCAECGHRRDLALMKKEDLEIVCEKCGTVEDQDRTAARNLMAMGIGIVRDLATQGKEIEPIMMTRDTRKKMGSRRTRKRVQPIAAVEASAP